MGIFKMISLDEILKKKFGLERFQGYQRAACEALINGEDVILIAPTGSGKSLCYQLPSFVRKGTALVISPLISLMNDQVAKLRTLGFRAASLNSGNSHLLNWQILIACSEQKIDFLFVTPERLREKNFSEVLRNIPVALIAVDEAHCISEWGHDFRPEYRLIKNGLSVITKKPPIIALSATATPHVQQDIIEQLGLNTPRKFAASFWRENIAIKTLDTPPEHRLDLILEVLSCFVDTPLKSRYGADPVDEFKHLSTGSIELCPTKLSPIMVLEPLELIRLNSNKAS